MCAWVIPSANVSSGAFHLADAQSYPLYDIGDYNDGAMDILQAETSDGFPPTLNSNSTVDGAYYENILQTLGVLLNPGSLTTGDDTVSLVSVIAERFVFYGDLSTISQDLVAAVTNALRSLSTTVEEGFTLAAVTQINVKWQWLALPMTILLLACICLVMTIIKTYHEQTVIWKSSALALMLHPLQGWSREEIGSHDTESGMMRKGQFIRGRLQRDGTDDFQIVRAV